MNNILIADYTLKLSKQDCFDKAWQWNEAKHKKCISENNSGACHYRNDSNTNACLIGVMIPDSVFIKCIVAGTVLHNELWFKIKHLFRSEVSRDFLYEIQSAHDSTCRHLNHNVQVKETLIAIAAKHNLKCDGSMLDKNIANNIIDNPIVTQKKDMASKTPKSQPKKQNSKPKKEKIKYKKKPITKKPKYKN